MVKDYQYLKIFEKSKDEWMIDTHHIELPFFLDKEPGKNYSAIRPGQIIEIDTFYILFNPENHQLLDHKIKTVEVKNLNYFYKNGTKGVDNVSFQHHSKDLICIMGPSGCGKSTLMKLLAGFFSPKDINSIKYNNHSYALYRDRYKDLIGYVPQDDLLFDNLTVYENMLYYGKLRNPQLNKKELDEKIAQLLIELNMSLKKNQVVGSEEKKILSGGERKRLNIALELLSHCDVLLLDEPTSGLSSFDTIKTIELLNHYTKRGKTLYVVIHQPSRDVFLKFSHLILMDKGGRLIYDGTTKDSLKYFSSFNLNDEKEISTADEIISILEQVKYTPDGDVVYQIEQGEKIPLRVRTPLQWVEEFKQYQKEKNNEVPQNSQDFKELPSTKDKGNFKKIDSEWIQFKFLFLRNFKNKIKDRYFVLLSLFIPFFLSLTISYILSETEGGKTYTYNKNTNIPKFLYLTSIIFIFLSISHSISEILKDRKILKKESLIGYSPLSYLTAKFLTLIFISSYQIFIYTVVSFLISQSSHFCLFQWLFVF